MKLANAALCGDVDCQTVWDLRLHRTCPRCLFSLYLPLSRFLNRPAKKEKGHATTDPARVLRGRPSLRAGMADLRRDHGGA